MVPQFSYISSPFITPLFLRCHSISRLPPFVLFSSFVLDSLLCFGFSGSQPVVLLSPWLFCIAHWLLCFLHPVSVMFYMVGPLLYFLFTFFPLYSFPQKTYSLTHSFITVTWITIQLCLETMLLSMYPVWYSNLDISLIAFLDCLLFCSAFILCSWFTLVFWLLWLTADCPPISMTVLSNSLAPLLPFTLSACHVKLSLA